MVTPAALAAALNGDVENVITASTPGGIQAQERAGQIGFVASESLPRVCNGCTRDQLEAMGIQFGEPVDDLFVAVSLPDGWAKVATGHSMHSDLLDDKGRKRAGIFYKAAFYDRSAYISLERRYSAARAPVCGWDSEEYDRDTSSFHGIVTDCDGAIWSTEEKLAPVPQDASREERLAQYGREDSLAKQAQSWLDEHYPDWRDPLAYWD